MANDAKNNSKGLKNSTGLSIKIENTLIKKKLIKNKDFSDRCF